MYFHWMKKRKKIIKPILSLFFNEIVLAYWIMCDGSLNSKIMILHTQSFTYEENLIQLSIQNNKWNLNAIIIPHKKKYWVIKIPSKSYQKQKEQINPYIHESMNYKLVEKK